MRILVIITLSFVCLAPYNQSLAGNLNNIGAYNFYSYFSNFNRTKYGHRPRKPKSAIAYNQFPKINIINDTQLTHNIYVEYAHGFKQVIIGGKITIDKLIYDGNTFENFTTGKVVHEMNFIPPQRPKKPWRKDIYSYEMTVYEKGREEMMCSSTIKVMPSASSQNNGSGSDIVGDGPCIATIPENNACTIKAHTFAHTCQIELSITELEI